jgi:peptidoglycan/xylan/chitin deacetylase (PgdA/CDA1 family)
MNPRPVSRPAWIARLALPLARLLAAAGLLPVLLWLADRVTLARDARGRARPPFVRATGPRAYQILLFHRVNDDQEPYFTGVPVARFRAQAEILARHWNILPLGELVDLAARNALPRRAAAITFDDGYRDNYEFAYPVLSELRLPATIFLATGAIETGRPLWHDRVFDAFRRTRARRLALGPRELPLDTPDQKHRALHALLEDLRARTPEDRELAVRSALAALGLTENPVLADRMLTWAQIREMHAQGIDFGAHSVSHPILTRMPLEAAMREILDSRRAIRERLDAPVDLFAYPNGSRDDFNGPLKEGLRAAGFRAAVTTIWGNNPATADPFELKRVGSWDADPRLAALRLGWYRISG